MISSKQVSSLTTLIGSELSGQRDQRTEAWRDRLLTQPPTVAEPPPALACVQIDGGRVQTRRAGAGHGVFDPHWRESKNAGFYRMATKTFEEDPHPELPTAFSSRKNMQTLLSGLPEDEAAHDTPSDFSWRPVRLFRSCLSSLCDSEQFGLMMAAEADRRGFFTASRRAFLGDGLSYNWKIHRKHFSTFEPILDFIHSVERLHEVSQAIEPDTALAWEQTKTWMLECWQGNIEEVIDILRTKQVAIGYPTADSDDHDPRKILAEALVYFTNNIRRMDYPRYRAAGLPITSCFIESQIKELNHRVKGSEKFWNDGEEAEAILQVTAAMLGDENQLAKHFQSRPGSPYTRRRTPK